MPARDSILARIRAAQHRDGTAAEHKEVAAHIGAHARGPRPQFVGDPVEHFCAQALSLGSTIARVSSRKEVPAAVALYLRGHALPLSAVRWPEFDVLPWAEAGLSVETRAAHGDDLVGITGAYFAIAETGTLMLLSGADTPATTSLLPETHIAIVDRACIVECMEDGWAMLRRKNGTLPRSVNFISGPSRTADIEQTLVIGAHGPYRVHILVVG